MAAAKLSGNPSTIDEAVSALEASRVAQLQVAMHGAEWGAAASVSDARRAVAAAEKSGTLSMIASAAGALQLAENRQSHLISTQQPRWTTPAPSSDPPLNTAPTAAPVLQCVAEQYSAAASFQGQRAGLIFKTDHLGVGYYVDREQEIKNNWKIKQDLIAAASLPPSPLAASEVPSEPSVVLRISPKELSELTLSEFLQIQSQQDTARRKDSDQVHTLEQALQLAARLPTALKPDTFMERVREAAAMADALAEQLSTAHVVIGKQDKSQGD